MKLENVKVELFAIIDENIDGINTSVKKLKEEDKKDEANLEKIKFNIYDIFKKMYGASEKKVYNTSNISDDNQKLEEFKDVYLSHFDKIPNNWIISLEKAKQHDDFEKIYIEELKLGVMEQIRSEFLRLWKEN